MHMIRRIVPNCNQKRQNVTFARKITLLIERRFDTGLIQNFEGNGAERLANHFVDR